MTRGQRGLGVYKSEHMVAPNHTLTRAATLSTLSACLASAHPWTFRVATVRVRPVSDIFWFQMNFELDVFTSLECLETFSNLVN